MEAAFRPVAPCRSFDMRRLSIVPLLLVLLPLAGCSGSARLAETNKELVRSFVEAVNAAEWDAVERLLADDFQHHSQAAAGPPVTTREEFVEYQRDLRASFPDQRIMLDDLVAEADRVAATGRYRGTQTGTSFNGAGPTGRAVEGRFVSMFRVVEGRIAEIWTEWDNLALYSQLGLPPPADGLGLLDRYLAAYLAGDVDALLRLHTGDAMFTVQGEPGRQGWESLRDLYEWNAALAGQLEFTDVDVDGELIRIASVAERNRLLGGLGVEEVHYRPGTRFKLRGQLVQGIYLPGLDEASRQAVDAAFEPVIAWLRTSDPATLEQLMPDGEFRYDAENAARWLEVVSAWRAATAPAANGRP